MSVFSNTAQDSPEDRAQYAQAVLALLGTRKPVDVLRATPGVAARAMATLTPEQLKTPEMPGKWSVAHVLRHLADTDVVWGWRMRLIDRATPADLERVGVHAERGEESAGYLVKLYAGHDLMHLAQIERITKAVT